MVTSANENDPSYESWVQTQQDALRTLCNFIITTQRGQNGEAKHREETSMTYDQNL